MLVLNNSRHEASTKVSSKQIIVKEVKMSNRSLRNRRVELPETDENEELTHQEQGTMEGCNAVVPLTEVHDSTILVASEVHSIPVETNNKNDGNMTEQMQDMLANVLSTLSNFQSQNAKANEELAAKLMAENQKLADRFTGQLQEEIAKVTQAINDLREETKGEIQSVRDELNKLSSSVDERVCRHIEHTKKAHDVLRTEIGKELKAAKQEIDSVKQDVNKKNQDVLDSLSRSDLANEQKFIEVDRQVAELRGQISSIASTTKVSPSNASTSDVIQMQQGQSGVETTDETRASMNENVEMECLHGMNGTSLHGKVCPTTPVDVSVTNNVNQVLPELALPKFSSRGQSAVNFLKDLDEYFKLKSVHENLKLAVVSKSLTEEFANNWFMATKEHMSSYEEFKIKFLDQFWSKELQSYTRAQIYRCRYDKSTDGSMASHLLKYAVLGTSLQPPMSEREVIEAVTSSYPPWVQKLLVTSHIETIQDALNVLNRLEAIDGHQNTSQQRPSQNTGQTRNNYHREDHRDGRTHAVRQAYIDQERRNVRNSRYPVQQGYNRHETYRRLGGSRRNHSPGRNVTNESALNPEATPYNQGRNSREIETESRMGN